MSRGRRSGFAEGDQIVDFGSPTCQLDGSDPFTKHAEMCAWRSEGFEFVVPPVLRQTPHWRGVDSNRRSPV